MQFSGFSSGRAAAALVMMAIGLTACSGVRDQLGLNRQAPDEFTVVRKAPLSLPPDFNLRPPTPGAPDDRAPPPTDVARRALTGNAATQSTAGRSSGEQALLRQAGTSQAESDIRQVLRAETTQFSDKDKTLVDRLIFWRDPSADDEDVIDPAAESRRIREASLSTGNTDLRGEAPTIRRRGRSLLGSIF